MRALVFLLVAVLIAGCVGQPTAQPVTGQGLVIKSFTADTTTQMSNRNVRLFLELENAGESVVNSSRALIYLSGPIGKEPLQWKLILGNKTEILKRDLRPYDPIRDIPAGRATIKWTLKTPTLDPGQQKTDSFTARAYYDYETKVLGEIVAYSEAEAEAYRERGEPLQKSEFKSTSGPIDVSVRVVPDPVIAVDSETVTMEITVTNVGGGTLYRYGKINSNTQSPSLSYDDLNRVNITVNVTGLSVTGCSGEQELIGGKPTTITCDMEVPKPATKKIYPVKIILDYGYYTDQEISLTAVGK